MELEIMELEIIDRFLGSDLMKEFKALHNIAFNELELMKDKATTLQTQTNLKLYDIAYKFELDHNFDWYCDQEYQFFSEFLKDKGLDTLQVGRTSSFYIVPARFNETFDDMDYTYTYGAPESIEYSDALDYVSYRYQCLKDYHDTNTEVIIEMLEDELTNEIDALEYFINFTVSEVEYDVTAVSEGYEYIETFMKYQVESYSEYLNFESELG